LHVYISKKNKIKAGQINSTLSQKKVI
jgi:hypothetical protein